jgi:hypothetical protein
MKQGDTDPKASAVNAAEPTAETFDEREARTKEFLLGNTERLLAVRNKDREFHGLEREFLYAQAQMLLDYKKSKDIKHPRDVGNARENILGRFLESSGYLPKKYSVSNTSVRVASTEGFISREIDILIFDRQTSIILMQREDAYQVYPIESSYAAIQVKSKLTKEELSKAFDNIASFKELKKVGTGHARSERGFGIIFAYDSDLKWMELVDAIKGLALSRSRSVLPNMVVVLSKGYFVFRENNAGKLRNAEIEAIQELQIMGNPDRQNLCLYGLYQALMMLLEEGEAPSVPIVSYFSLPLTSGQYSYQFAFGFVSELGSCGKHGDYLRKIGEGALKKVFDFCQTTQPIGYLEALSEASGQNSLLSPGQRSRLVWIYNPEQLALSDILVNPNGSIAFDEIRCADIDILIPLYYSEKEGIISGCKACAKRNRPSEPGETAAL